MTLQALYIWQDNYYVYDIIVSIYDISYGVLLTTQPLYPTSNILYLCNHTHLIDDITGYVCKNSHPLHVEHYTIGTVYDITSTLDDIIPLIVWWHPLCLWHHIHHIWCHTHCVYDNTSSISDLIPILPTITSTVYVITPALWKTSHKVCKTSQVA